MARRQYDLEHRTIGRFETCQTYIEQIDDAGGDALMMYLPDLGIRGNSHMLMQDRNSNELAELMLEWIDTHVEAD